MTRLWREMHTQSHQRQRLMVVGRLSRLSVLATQFMLGNMTRNEMKDPFLRGWIISLSRVYVIEAIAQSLIVVIAFIIAKTHNFLPLCNRKCLNF
jgi:hypothetical protein